MIKTPATSDRERIIHPREAVRIAKKLHLLLFDDDLPRESKSQLARKIAGNLFSAEANSRISNRTRILFLCLRTHAHRASLLGAPFSQDETVVAKQYEELESLLERGTS